MATFQVTAAELRKTAEVLRAQNAKLTNEINDLSSQEEAMSAYYEGDARQKFKAAVKQDVQKINQFISTITEYAAALDIAAAEYDKAEARASSIASTRNA